MRPSSVGKALRQPSIPKSRFCEHTSNDNDQTTSCRQRIYVTCPHCQRSLCLYHINEHQILIRTLFDSLINRLNEYRYELTVTLIIPPPSELIVKNCLNEFKHTIIPYVQRTCCQNDVKQEDINRIQIFIDKMSSIVQQIQLYWSENTKNESKRSKDSDNPNSPSTSNKRSRTDSTNTIIILE